MSVSIGPGMISTTRMPNGATSTRRLSPKAEAAAFEARYAEKKGTEAMIDDEVTVQTTDGWLARRVGMAAAVNETTPKTLVSNIRRQSSMLACSTGR